MKKLVALLVILAVVLTGVFAEDYPTATVKLIGQIGPLFRHGVVVDGALVASKDFDDAAGANVFGADGTTFDYGYSANQNLVGYKLYLTISDFTTAGQNPKTIQIASVLLGPSKVAGVPDPSNNNRITIFDQLTDNGMDITQKSITVKAAQTVSGNDYKGAPVEHAYNNATNGIYTSTLTFSVVGN